MLDDDPIARFRDLMARAQSVEPHDPTAACLATADGEGRPGARMVLLKGVEDEGFLFFTNYASRKAVDLARNPEASLCFFWPALYTQVRVEGSAEKLSGEASDVYFASRPRGHQLAAWASRQSTPLESRRELLGRYHEMEERFRDGEIPRPPFWGGYRLRPRRIEFWHGFENRLHDRLVFTRDGDAWTVERLNP